MRKSFEVGTVVVVVAATAGEPSEGVRAGLAGGGRRCCRDCARLLFIPAPFRLCISLSGEENVYVGGMGCSRTHGVIVEKTVQ